MLLSALIRFFYLAFMFLAGLVLSNLALPEAFGTISLMVLNASLLSIVTGLGTDSMMQHKVAKQEWCIAKAALFTWQAVAIQLVLFFVLETGSLVVRHKTLLSNEQPGFLLSDFLFFTGILLTERYLSLLYAFHRARLANWLLAIVAIIYLLLLVLISFNNEVTFRLLMGIFVGQSLVQGLLLAGCFYLINQPARKETLHLHEFLQLIKLSSVVMITNVIQLLAYRLDFWLIKFFYANYEVGIYAQANKFANLMWIAPNIMAQLLIPKFSQLPHDDVPKLFSTAFYSNFLLIVMTAGCAAFFYLFYLNPVYLPGLPAFFLMLPGYFFWAAVIYFGAYFSWQGKFVYNLFCSAGCFVIIFFADLLLIPRFSLNGAAVANTIAYTAVFLLYLFLLRRRYFFRWKDLLLLPRKDFMKMVKFVTG